jgi:hypothetical protein
MVATAQPLIRMTGMSAVAEAFLQSEDPLPDRLARLCASLEVRIVLPASWVLALVYMYYR